MAWDRRGWPWVLASLPSLSFPFPVPQVWCGSFQVTTGLQVPSSVRCLQKRGSATSSSNTSLT